MLLAFGPITALTSAIPQHLDKRSISYQMTCDAARNPDWGDCKKVYSHVNKITKKNSNYVWPISTDPTTNAVTYTFGNCVVALSNFSLNKGIPDYLVVTASDSIISDCTPGDAGGNAINNDGSMGLSIYSSGKSSSEMLRREEAASTIEVPPTSANAQPDGSQWTLTNSQTQSKKGEASASVNADFFKIFFNIVNHCKEDQTGTLYWYPRFYAIPWWILAQWSGTCGYLRAAERW
nr:hypothetical protein B0A51_05259 [Rachicladosporium sp. CCFEE 5018]